MSVLYATLAEVKQQMQANTTTDDSIATALLRQVSRRVDRYFKSQRPLFAPVKETRQLAFAARRISSVHNTFALRDPLLSLDSVTVMGTALGASAVEAWGVSQPMAPYYHLRLTDPSTSWYDNYDQDVAPQVSVAGVWGWHADYANAYVSLDALAAGIDASTTSLTVADADGTDEYGLTPRFSVGSILRIDSELMDVTAVDTGTNTLTVRRAVLGTTAAAHDNAAAVEVYRVDEDIRQAVTRQVGLQYARRGAYDVLTTDGVTTTQFPSDVLATFRNILMEFAYL